jgi:transcriptional regulator with XRE-family HTH domain
MRTKKDRPILEKPIYKTIGSNLQIIRAIKGLTQNDIAIMAGCSRVSIANIETGKQKVTIDTLTDIAIALDVPINILFTQSSTAEALYWKDKYIHNEQRYQILKLKVNELVQLLNNN